tara:strand:- start:824 stop:1024 length:201 start_codon:yes stop_codon:yes gene_type:complete
METSNLTPFEKALKSRQHRDALAVMYILALRAMAQSIQKTGNIDHDAQVVLAAVAAEAESRLGISA